MKLKRKKADPTYPKVIPFDWSISTNKLTSSNISYKMEDLDINDIVNIDK